MNTRDTSLHLDPSAPDVATLPHGCEILVLEDDVHLRKRLLAHLRSNGAEVTEADTLEGARRLLREINFDFAAIDLHLPDGEGLQLLRENLFSENTVVVVMTAFGGIRKAVEAIKLGAGDFLAKPFEIEQLPLAFARCLKSRSASRRDEARKAPAGDEGFFFGESLRDVRARLDTIFAAEARLQRQLPPILIEGETGTGKSVLARWIHRGGPRAARPLVPVNCAALPETLAESELFGHERGAFTDAKQARIGLFEAADGGTLFLDEIGSLTPGAQAKVLTAVEEGVIRRLGGTKEIGIDVRLIAASNQTLESLVAAGRFREDLYHRLHLLHLRLPPLRERGSDLLALATHLLRRLVERYRLPQLSITAEGKARLLAQRWPGNVRELSHELERAVIFHSGPTLEFAHLGPLPTHSPGSTATPWRNPAWRLPENGFVLEDVISQLVEESLRETGNNVSAAARRLGVTREYLRYRLNDTGSTRRDGTDSAQ